MGKRDQFIEKLQELLKEFDCEITADDHWQGYAECGQDVRMTVEFEDYKIEEIDLGKYIDSAKPIHKIIPVK